MKHLFALIAVGMLLCGCSNKDNTPYEPPKPRPKDELPETPSNTCKVFLAGDSTCAPKAESERPKYGWGEKFAQYLNGFTVENKAVGGKSTKTFISGGQWAKMLKSVSSGYVVLIQFGHNDENQTASDGRGTTPDEYRTNLATFISEVKAKGAVPVILTPICRRSFSDGAVNRTHGEYPAAAKKAAADGGAVLLDIEQLSFEWLTNLGEEASASRFMFSVDGADNTHLTEQGANEIANLVAQALKDSNNSYLAALVK